MKQYRIGLKNRLMPAIIGGLIVTIGSAHAQTITTHQLKGLLPDEKSLTGFTRLMPAGEIYLPAEYSQKEHRWIQEPISPSVVLEDQISIKPGANNSLNGSLPLSASIVRQLYSLDGAYRVVMTADVFASVADAQKSIQSFRRECSSPFQFGKPSELVKFDWKIYVNGGPAGAKPFGDESYYNVNLPSTILMRTGPTVILLYFSRSNQTSKFTTLPEFSVSRAEVFAEDIAKRAAAAEKLISPPFNKSDTLTNP